MYVRHTAWIGCVSGGGVSGGSVGGWVVGSGGVGWRVGGVVIWWWLHVGRDGDFIYTPAETSQSKVGQDSLYKVKKDKLNKTVNDFTKLLNCFYCDMLLENQKGSHALSAMMAQ